MSKRASGEPDRIFRTNFRVNLAGDYLVDILGHFSLEEDPLKNPQQNSNKNLGVAQPHSTLQGSGLDKMKAYKYPIYQKSSEHFIRNS